MNLSTHFSLAEFTNSQMASRLGIDNDPPDELLDNLRRTANGLEGIRILLGVPIVVSSGYRSLALNRALGSKDTSQHVTGQAVDFTAPGFGGPRHVADRIIDAGIYFDQCILEYPASPSGGWVHVSFVANGARNQALTIDADGTRPLVA
jgi:zinc D-Ala-D-Ala carboxypeptidase